MNSYDPSRSRITPAPAPPIKGRVICFGIPANCSNCHFFKQWEEQPAASRFIIGDCRMDSPTNFQIADNKFMTKWPSVRSTDFCGQFSPKLSTTTDIKA